MSGKFAKGHTLNRGRILSAEHKQKNANAHRGKRYSDETKKKHSDFMSQEVECPACGQIGSRFPMYRWHFNNCSKA